MMGAVARAARAGGAHTVGRDPGAPGAVEVADTDADELIVVDTMRERKRMMDERVRRVPGAARRHRHAGGAVRGLDGAARSACTPSRWSCSTRTASTTPLWDYLEALRDTGFVRPAALDGAAPGERTVDDAFAALAHLLRRLEPMSLLDERRCSGRAFLSARHAAPRWCRLCAPTARRHAAPVWFAARPATTSSSTPATDDRQGPHRRRRHRAGRRSPSTTGAPPVLASSPSTGRVGDLARIPTSCVRWADGDRRAAYMGDGPSPTEFGRRNGVPGELLVAPDARATTRRDRRASLTDAPSRAAGMAGSTGAAPACCTACWRSSSPSGCSCSPSVPAGGRADRAARCATSRRGSCRAERRLSAADIDAVRLPVACAATGSPRPTSCSTGWPSEMRRRDEEIARLRGPATAAGEPPPLGEDDPAAGRAGDTGRPRRPGRVAEPDAGADGVRAGDAEPATGCRPSPTGRAAAGRPRRRTTSPTTTTSGACRCTARTRCSSGCRWRRSSPGCPG